MKVSGFVTEGGNNLLNDQDTPSHHTNCGNPFIFFLQDWKADNFCNFIQLTIHIKSYSIL